LIVYDKQNNQLCSIDDGGIWVREEIYLSANERYLLSGEYSGSSCDIVSYDMNNCRQIKRLDVSDTCRWKVEANQAYLGKQCSGDDVASCSVFKHLDLKQLAKSK